MYREKINKRCQFSIIFEGFKKSEDLFFQLIKRMYCIKFLFNYILLPKGVAVATNIFIISDN